MSFVRFSYAENPVEDLRNKIRHTYDLNQLLRKQEFMDFFKSSAFDELLIKVGEDDVNSFRNNNKWLNNHLKEALLFREVEMEWEQLEATYYGDFSPPVYGSLPKAEMVSETLKIIRDRLQQINWTVGNK